MSISTKPRYDDDVNNDLPRMEQPHRSGERPAFAGMGHNSEGPQPLVREMPRAESYPVTALGKVLGGMARALHEDAVQSPLALCGTAVLAAAALAVQGHVDVELPTGQTSPTSMFFLTVAESGERKSSTDNYVLKAVQERESELSDIYQNNLGDHRNAIDAWTSEREKIKRDKKLNGASKKREFEILGAEPQPPALPFIRYSEATIEGLITKLRQGYPSVGIFTSEGAQFICGHGFSDESKLRTASALNKMWDGAPIDRVRAAGDAFTISGRRVSIHLQAQPDVAMLMLNDSALRDVGYLARFLLAQPESTMGARLYREKSPINQLAIVEFTMHLRRHLQRELPFADGKKYELAPRILPLSQAAQHDWWRFHDHIEKQLSRDGALRPVSGIANKIPEHAARIAAVMATFENADAVEVSAAHLERGIEIAQHHLGETLRLLGSARVNSELAEAQRLLDWLQKWPEGYISVKPIVRLGPSAIRDTKTAKRLVAALVEHGWLKCAPRGTVVDNTITREAWQIMKAEA